MILTSFFNAYDELTPLELNELPEFKWTNLPPDTKFLLLTFSDSNNINFYFARLYTKLVFSNSDDDDMDVDDKHYVDLIEYEPIDKADHIAHLKFTIYALTNFPENDENWIEYVRDYKNLLEKYDLPFIYNSY